MVQSSVGAYLVKISTIDEIIFYSTYPYFYLVYASTQRNYPYAELCCLRAPTPPTACELRDCAFAFLEMASAEIFLEIVCDLQSQHPFGNLC